MRKFLLYVVLWLFCIDGLQSQYYIDLGDNVGVDVEQFQASLDTAAKHLVEAFPSTYQDSFRVFSTGFYLHSGDFESGFPGAFEEAIGEARAQSKYYLLIGRESGESGVYTKFWVSLELPRDSVFICLNEAKRKIEELRCLESLNSNLPLSTPAQYVARERAAMATLTETVEKLMVCCDPGSRTSCEICPDAGLIRDLLLSLGFIGVDATNVTNGVPNTTFSNIIDYSGKSIDGTQLAVRAATALQNVLNPNKQSARAYITDNWGICNDSTFDLAQTAYESDINDFDIWIHLWQSEDLSQSVVFVKADFLILLDDPDFVSYILDQPISLTEGPPTRAPLTEDVFFLIYDPGNNKYFYSSILEQLPHTEPPEVVHMPDQPLHIVKSGETLSGIAAASGGGFTVDSLIAWNPDKLEGPGTILQIGWELKLYTKEYLELLADDLTVYGIAMPVVPLESYNLIPLNQVPQHGLIGTPGPVDEILKYRHKTITIPKELPAEDVGKVVNPNKWQKLKPFAKGGKVLLRIIGGAANVALLVLEPAPVGNHMPVNYYKWSIDNEPDDKRLTYCTYTKYKSDAANIGLPDGKVYVGRTSGYNKDPMTLIAMRNVVHHKNGEGYGDGCYDDHEYSTTNNRNNRHSDRAYQIIRGREQVVIEAMGGAWSDNIDIRATRSGNAINGIAKNSGIYLFYTGLSIAKCEAYGRPIIPPITWVPSEYCFPGW